MSPLEKIAGEIEVHSVEGIKECFANGISANAQFNGRPLFEELTGNYLRSPDFRHCVRAFVDHGLEFEDGALLAVLLDDSTLLQQHLDASPEALHKRYTLRCAFTPLYQATLLHICAEYNHAACARLIVSLGADPNAPAGRDENGFGGQTPVFHTVNQALNRSEAMLDYLLSLGVDLDITVRGLVWGRGYEWETFIPAVNPLSYAMMGLIPQMHRTESSVAKIVERLLRAAYGLEYRLPNVPNKYLKR